MAPVKSKKTAQPLYVLMINLHGLIRANNLELGRDSDTGGQTSYVLELAKHLALDKQVEKVDILTRLIDDSAVDDDYRAPVEAVSDKVDIVRVPFGPKRYLSKEKLWPHLAQAIDRCLHLLRQQDRLPDIIHTHYADAAYVGEQLSLLLGIPLVHTGHSLGKPKRQRMLAGGGDQPTIEKQFKFRRRILSEESIIKHSSLIVTSTQQEIETQYGMYTNQHEGHFRVIPPGTNTARFAPPKRKKIQSATQIEIDKFFAKPEKPIILCICRADVRKNIKGLVDAYGQSQALQDKANLLIIAGTRDDIQSLEPSQSEVLSNLLLDIDRYDLWGKIAIPKHITQDQVPEAYRLAAQRKGLFINAAFTEPFGLTLIEAAASGLPIVAPDDGGPQDIIQNCQNGYLSNTLDSNDIAEKMLNVLSDPKQWQHFSKKGLSGVAHHYNWPSHVKKYMKEINAILHRSKKKIRREQVIHQTTPTQLPLAKAALISDIDNTLLGDDKAVKKLISWLKKQNGQMAFGIATGRHLVSALEVLTENNVPIPDVLITSVGTEIHYGENLISDLGWAEHIRYQWRREAIVEAMKQYPKIKLQAPENQLEFKVSYTASPEDMPDIEVLNDYFASLKLRAQIIYSHDEFLDILPIRASKGKAIRYLSYKWGLPLSHFMTSGDSGNDVDMLTGDTLGIVVGNHASEMTQLKGQNKVFFADGHYSAGILEGISHYTEQLSGAMS